MEMPSKRYIALMGFGGFLIALLEPIILLLMGDDLGGAFWPMAKRSLDWTYFLRENRTIVFAFFILAVPLSYLRSRSVGNLEKSIFVVFIGFIIGLLGIFLLLNWAYYRDAFLLLPTTYGFLLLCSALIIRGIPDNPFSTEEGRVE
ncbi:MAG: hypothetical protein ACPGNS_06620, partial [Candidatus Poseidoniaceae archaeon]